MVLSAPTHPIELAVYDPRLDSDRVFYPAKPYGAPRLAFMSACGSGRAISLDAFPVGDVFFAKPLPEKGPYRDDDAR